MQAGNLDAADSNLQAAINTFQTIPDHVGVAEATGLLGQCHLRQGNLKQALVVLQEAQQLIAERGFRGHQAASTRIGYAAACLYAAEHDQQERRERLNAAQRA
jgi:hypothetical protein